VPLMSCSISSPLLANKHSKTSQSRRLFDLSIRGLFPPIRTDINPLMDLTTSRVVNNSEFGGFNVCTFEDTSVTKYQLENSPGIYTINMEF
jgi:hypothetical protein